MTTDRDVMQTRAETATVGKKVAGLDGLGWVAAIRAYPGCTLPPGAASLVVAYFDSLMYDIQSANFDDQKTK